MPPAGDRPAPGWRRRHSRLRVRRGVRGELPSRPPSTQAKPSRRGPWRPGRSCSGALHLDAMNHARSTMCGPTADGMGAGESGGLSQTPSRRRSGSEEHRDVLIGPERLVCPQQQAAGSTAPADRIGPLAPQRGDELELPRAQPGERGYPGRLRCRDHTSHNKIISVVTSSYGTPSRPPDPRRIRDRMTTPDLQAA